MCSNFLLYYDIQMLARARKAFSSNVTKDIAFRKKQLKSLRSMLVENEQLMVDALMSDLRKSKFETVLYEVDLVKNEIQVMLNNIDTWSKPQSASKSLMTMFDKVSVKYEPYGVVLIIGAWNYPIQLSLGPLVGAIAAGNCAILKPSELTPKIARVISELLPRYLDKVCITFTLIIDFIIPSSIDIQIGSIFFDVDVSFDSINVSSRLP